MIILVLVNGVKWQVKQSESGVNALKNLRINAKRLRIAQSLSQEALAEKAGLEYKHYQKIESGKWPGVYLQTMEALAAALKVSIGSLLDPPPPDAPNILLNLRGGRPKGKK